MSVERETLLPTRRFQNPGTLPNIRASNDPDFKMDRALVPVNGGQNEIIEERLKHLETRLVVSEKSSRALLDEIVRLQSTIRSQLRRQDELIREERQARQQLETTIKSNNDVVLELARRIQTTEEKVHDEKTTLSDLISQTKSVEMAFRSMDGVGRRGDIVSKVRDVQQQVDELQRNKIELEQLAMQIVDEMRSIKTRVDTHAVEQNGLVNEVRSRNKRLEDEYIKQLYESLKRNEAGGNSDFNWRELRAQVELRMAEMRELFVELKGRQDLETQERKIAEQQLQIKMNEMSILLGDSRRNLGRNMPNDDAILRQVENAVARERSNIQQQWDLERSHLQSKMGELLDDLQRRLADRETRAREEFATKNGELEKMLRAEQDSRNQFERDLRHENDKKWDTIRKMAESQSVAVKDVSQDTTRYKEAIQKVDEGVNILQQLIEETRSTMDKILSAEIKARTRKDRELSSRIDSTEEKLGVATASLQQAINGLVAKIDALQEKLKREPGTSNIAGVDDARLQSLVNRLAAAEQRLNQKIEQLDAAWKTLETEKVDPLLAWKLSVTAGLEKLLVLQKLPKQINLMQKRLEELSNDCEARMEAETTERTESVEELRAEIAKLRQEMAKTPNTSKAPAADPKLAARIDECNETIKKLAKALTDVKSVLGLKIYNEQNLRNDQLRLVQHDLAELRVYIEQLAASGSFATGEDEETPTPRKAKAEEQRKKLAEAKAKEMETLREISDQSPPHSKEKENAFNGIKQKEVEDVIDKSPEPPPRPETPKKNLPAKPPPSTRRNPVDVEEEEEEEAEEEENGEEEEEEDPEEDEEEEAPPPRRKGAQKPAAKGSKPAADQPNRKKAKA